MFIVEILALCGVTQIITTSYLFASVRRYVPTDHLKYMLSCSQCMGFWIGFGAYVAVALYSLCCPDTDFIFPIAHAVAVTGFWIQCAFVVLLGGLISLCSILVNHVIEFLHFCKMWYVTAIEQDVFAAMNEDFEKKNANNKDS